MLVQFSGVKTEKKETLLKTGAVVEFLLNTEFYSFSTFLTFNSCAKVGIIFLQIKPIKILDEQLSFS